MNLMQGALAVTAGMCGSVVAALILLQEKLIYHPSLPSREYEQLPSDHAMRYEDVELVTADGVRLHAWLIRQSASASAPTFVYFHGNAGNIGHRLTDVRLFYSSGFNMLVVSYRGYGASEGTPTERGMRLDARAAVDYCRDRADVLDTSQIFLFGRSIGGAVAIATAATLPPGTLAGVVVENTFTSMGDMIDKVLPPLRFAKMLNRNPWDSLTHVRGVRTPLLFISGLRDELVPPQHVKALHDAAVSARIKHFFVVENGSHNDTWFRGGERFRQAIRNFVDTVAASSDGDASASDSTCED